MSNDKAREVEILTIQGIMSSKDSRSYIYSLLERSGMFTDMFDPDPYGHALNAGQRRQGLILQQDLLDAAPAEYLRMISEQVNG